MSLNSLYKEAQENKSLPSVKCVVGVWADSLTEEDHAAFTASLSDSSFTSRALFDLYKSAGAPFGITTLKDHRNERCVCH